MRRSIQVVLRLLPAAAVAGAVIVAASPAVAQSSRVVLIEEHWTLQTTEPDVEVSAPQTTMVMSPTGDLGGTHFLFTINHSSAPEYRSGGLQVQRWEGDDFAEESTDTHTESLEYHDEPIKWVQRMSLQDGSLKFAVVNGESESWGEFGGERLSLSVATSLTSLNGYRPAVSLGESQVNYAENRVASLVLTKLVWVTEDGHVHEHDAPIPIDTTVGE